MTKTENLVSPVYSRYQSFNPIFFLTNAFLLPTKNDEKFIRTKIGEFFLTFHMYMYFCESILFRFLLTGSLLLGWVVIQILAYRFIDLHIIIFVQRDAWNRALPFITLHVCSHVIWRCTKWVPITSGVLTRQGTSITHTNDVARLPSGSLCCVPTGRSCNVQIVD